MLTKVIFIRLIFFGAWITSIIILMRITTKESLTKIITKSFTKDSTMTQKQASTKYILYWNQGFNGVNNMYLDLGKDIFDQCEMKHCVATNDRTLLPVEQFDAIIFYGPTLNKTLPDKSEIKEPKNRTIYQKYVYYSRESPIRFGVNRFSNNFYNWTMNYRRDSDIFAPYSLVQKKETKYSPPTLKDLKKKTKMATWFVSNCDAEIRNKYVHELQKYVSVDIYGKCGNMSCPKSNAWSCLMMLQEKYWFYLAFENSMCKDYVTEKMFDVLKFNVIPVVLGYVDYKNIAPPDSVINAGDFSSPQALSKYLLELTNNIEKYMKYFEWKKKFSIVDSEKSILCQLCKKLHEPLNFSNYNDLRKWSLGENDSICSTSYPFN